MTDDETAHESVLPPLIGNEVPLPSDFNPRQWTVRIRSWDASPGPDLEPSRVAGFVVNQDWVITANHVIMPEGKPHWTKIDFYEDSGGSEGWVMGGDWIEEFVPGRGDIVALRIKRQYRDKLAGHVAPVNWDFNPEEKRRGYRSHRVWGAPPPRKCHRENRTFPRGRVHGIHVSGPVIEGILGRAIRVGRCWRMTRQPKHRRFR